MAAQGNQHAAAPACEACSALLAAETQAKANLQGIHSLATPPNPPDPEPCPACSACSKIAARVASHRQTLSYIHLASDLDDPHAHKRSRENWERTLTDIEQEKNRQWWRVVTSVTGILALFVPPLDGMLKEAWWWVAFLVLALGSVVLQLDSDFGIYLHRKFKGWSIPVDLAWRPGNWPKKKRWLDNVTSYWVPPVVVVLVALLAAGCKLEIWGLKVPAPQKDQAAASPRGQIAEPALKKQPSPDASTPKDPAIPPDPTPPDDPKPPK